MTVGAGTGHAGIGILTRSATSTAVTLPLFSRFGRRFSHLPLQNLEIVRTVSGARSVSSQDVQAKLTRTAGTCEHRG